MLTLLHFGLGLRGRFAVEGGVLLLPNMTGAALGLYLSARAATTETAIALLPVMLLPIMLLPIIAWAAGCSQPIACPGRCSG